MKKNEFCIFLKENSLGNEIKLDILNGVVSYTTKWNKGINDENDTADIILHFEDGDIKSSGIKSNGDNLILLDDWNEIQI